MSIDFIEAEGLDALKKAAELALETAPAAPWYVAESPTSGLPESFGYAAISSPEHGCFIEIPAKYHPESQFVEGEKVKFAPAMLQYLAMLDPDSTLDLIEQIQVYRDHIKTVKTLLIACASSQSSAESGVHIAEMAKVLGISDSELKGR